MQGFSFWDEAIDSEIYGSRSSTTTAGTGQTTATATVSTDRTSTPKKITDSIVFSNFGEGFQFYGSPAARSTTFTLEGNTVFQNGTRHGFTRNVLVGGDNPAQNPKLISNYLYYSPRRSTRPP